MFSFHLIIFDDNRSSIEPPDRLFSMIDYEKSNNRTTLIITCIVMSNSKNFQRPLWEVSRLIQALVYRVKGSLHQIQGTFRGFSFRDFSNSSFSFMVHIGKPVSNSRTS